MAGQPRWNALKTRLNELGGIEYVCERIRAGDTLKVIASDLKTSRQSMYKYINNTDDNKALFRTARSDGAHALVEDAMEILDDSVGEDSAGASVAKNRADMRKWLASVSDRDSFGPPQPAATQVNFNLGIAHLDALKAHGGPKLIDIPEGECEAVGAEAC